MRSDHLLAVLEYAIEQAKSSDIEVLDYGDNENALALEDQVEWLLDAKQQVLELVQNGHRDLELK